MYPLTSGVPLDGRAKGALPGPVLGRKIPRGRDVALLLNWQARAYLNSGTRKLPPTLDAYSVGIPDFRPRFDRRNSTLRQTFSTNSSLQWR